jgi:hypothetical protein
LLIVAPEELSNYLLGRPRSKRKIECVRQPLALRRCFIELQLTYHQMMPAIVSSCLFCAV